MTPRLGCRWEVVLAGRHFERGANVAPLKAEALTSLAEDDGRGKVRAAIKAATTLVLESFA
jgi:hypothetical protein